MKSNVRKILRYLILILIPVSMAGCLTCERKEYVFQLTNENAGKLTIKYVNIFSSLIDSTGELSTDYDELINIWLIGEKIERDFPKAKKFKKRLFKENGILCGEVTMEFDDLASVNLFRHNRKGPYMFSMAAVTDDNEVFLQSNGDFLGDKMPVIFWPDDTRTLRFATKIATPDSTTVSMLDRWEYNQF